MTEDEYYKGEPTKVTERDNYGEQTGYDSSVFSWDYHMICYECNEEIKADVNMFIDTTGDPWLACHLGMCPHPGKKKQKGLDNMLNDVVLNASEYDKLFHVDSTDSLAKVDTPWDQLDHDTGMTNGIPVDVDPTESDIPKLYKRAKEYFKQQDAKWFKKMGLNETEEEDYDESEDTDTTSID